MRAVSALLLSAVPPPRAHPPGDQETKGALTYELNKFEIKRKRYPIHADRSGRKNQDVPAAESSRHGDPSTRSAAC